MTGHPTRHALQMQAERWLQAGQVGPAMAAYQQLLALDPSLADAWFNLAYLQQQARRFDEALDSYAKVIEFRGAAPEEAHLNRAVILAERLARPLEAEAELRAALRLKPDHLPALLNLGNVLEHRGQASAARAVYERALALDRHHALALSRLAGLHRPVDAGDPILDRLRAALRRPGLGATEAADLGFALGAALDAIGAYDEAFAAYQAANAASRASAGPERGRYDRTGHERLVTDMVRAFERPLAPTALGEPRPAPIFICGMFRSGSTLVETILGRHPQVEPGGELDLLPAVARTVLGQLLRDRIAPDAAAIDRLRQSYLQGLARLFPSAPRVTDKRPDNFLYIGLIKALFPDAKIIHTRRAPLDNGLSVYFLHLGHTRPWATSLSDIGHWYRQYERLMAHWRALFPQDIVDVDYDELVVRPREVVAGVLAACGLDWDEACLAFERADAVVRTASAWQVRQPLYTRSSGRWRHYEKHLDELRQALAL